LEVAAPASGWRAAHAPDTRPRDDLIRTAVVKPPIRSRLSPDSRMVKNVGLVAAIVLVVAGAGVGIAVAIGGGGTKSPAADSASASTSSTVPPTTTVPSLPITSVGAAALDFRVGDMPAGWTQVAPATAPRSDMVPDGNCAFGKGLMLWVALSGVFADSSHASADQFAFDSVDVEPSDSEATATLDFAASATYQQTCLHPAVLDTLQPYVDDQTVTKCTQPLNYAGDQIATGNETYASSPAFTTHWVGWYECPTNQQLVYFYVDQVIMAAGKSAVAAYFIGISAQPSSQAEWNAMSRLSLRAAQHGL
jgi:hypothetical protein